MATAWQQSAGAGSGGGQSGHLQFLLVASGEAGQVRAQALGFFATSDFFRIGLGGKLSENSRTFQICELL